MVRGHQGFGGRLYRPSPGADLPAQPRHPEGSRGRPRSYPHGDQGGFPGPPQGDRRLGELPGHDDRASGRLGLAEHRPQAHQPRADHVRALRHGLSRHLLRCVGERTGRLCSGRVSVGIQPDDDGRGPFRRRRHHRGYRPQVLVRVVHGRPDRRQGGGQVREGHEERTAPGERAGIPPPREADLPAAGELPDRPQRDRRRDRIAELPPPDPRSSAPREDHGRIRRRHQHQLHDERRAARARPRAARHAEGRHEQHGRRRPSLASAHVGAAPPAAGLGVRHPAHAVPRGNALAGVLLPRRSHEAG